MNRHVNAIAGRLSLRPPQREALEILDRVTEIAPPGKGGGAAVDLTAALAAIRSEFPSVTDFERAFPSLCFALATGVGKTRLMGAFISYLYLAHGLRNYFVLAPNLTIYNKLITDFTPNTPKYVFKGISEFAINPPAIVTGDNYEGGAGVRSGSRPRLPGLDEDDVINIFNISKINSEVRGGRSPRIKRLSEYIGESYFEYLAGLDDLVMLMDESHRYRASAGARAINELRPVLGLELTATPFVEARPAPLWFENVILDYPLGKAMADGFVKEPAVVTRKDFQAGGMPPEAIEKLKLEDGVRLHESIKVDLNTYASETGQPVVKPFVLVIARDTTHAAQLLALIQSESFFEGRYAGKVIQVDSSTTGAAEDAMVTRLLNVEQASEPTEIVIHVNMLKEGWDVTNLYTIIPLRAANARTLIEQSIGRGLRLPYGRRTGVVAVDRLNIVAHDRFQEIVDEASRPDSAIRLQQVVLDPAELQQRSVTVVAQSRIAEALGFGSASPGPGALPGLVPSGGQLAAANRATSDAPATEMSATSGVGDATPEPPLFASPEEQRVAQITYRVIRSMESQPDRLPSVSRLNQPETQAAIVKEVSAQYQHQPAIPGLTEATSQPDLAAVVARTAAFVAQQTIDIPRIVVLPKGTVRAGFRTFALDVRPLAYPPPDDDLWIKHLRTGQMDVLGLSGVSGDETRLEDYVVSGLIDFDDVSYDDHAELLYDLAGQTVQHFRSYLPTEEDARRVLQLYQRQIAQFVHAQMQAYYWEEATDYEVKVSRGFTELRQSAFSASATDPVLSFRQAPPDRSRMTRYLFGGFARCLYPVVRFQSDTERVMAVILDRDAQKWFRPARGQFQLYYKWGADHPEYQPDFVAETADSILMVEPKMDREMDDAEVLAKRDAAVRWCKHASAHTASYGGKPWKYVLIPHSAVNEGASLGWLAGRYGAS